MIPILHVTYAMPNARNAQRKLYIFYKGAPTHKAHKPLAPRGRQKGLDTAGKRAKEHKTHKLPLNTCIRFKEDTKLTLYT
jgi:hypothetical protein